MEYLGHGMTLDFARYNRVLCAQVMYLTCACVLLLICILAAYVLAPLVGVLICALPLGLPPVLYFGKFGKCLPGYTSLTLRSQ